MSNTPPLGTRSQSMTVLLLAMLLGLQPITTDLYLPALPALTEGFNASMVQAQLTLTALLLAFGTSQLVWGPCQTNGGADPYCWAASRFMWPLPLAVYWRLALRPSLQREHFKVWPWERV